MWSSKPMNAISHVVSAIGIAYFLVIWHVLTRGVTFCYINSIFVSRHTQEKINTISFKIRIGLHVHIHSINQYFRHTAHKRIEYILYFTHILTCLFQIDVNNKNIQLPLIILRASEAVKKSIVLVMSVNLEPVHAKTEQLLNRNWRNLVRIYVMVNPRNV